MFYWYLLTSYTNNYTKKSFYKLTIASLLVLSSCVIWDDSKLLLVNEKGLSINLIPLWIPQSLSQINTQELFSETEKKIPFQYDWLFRRLRLSYLNRYLSKNPADILLISSLLENAGSIKSNSELEILKSRYLNDLSSHFFEIYNNQQQSNTQLSAQTILKVIVYSGLVLTPSKNLSLGRQKPNQMIWPWKPTNTYPLFSFEGGQLISITHQNRSILILMVMISDNNLYNKYQSLVHILQILLKDNPHVCEKRLLIAGYLPKLSQKYDHPFSQLGLIDSGQNTCDNNPPACDTQTIDNPLYKFSEANRNHRIFIPKSANLVSSKRILDNKFDFSALNNQDYQKFLPISANFGWNIELIISERCED